jgi:hypothetical protein
MNAPTDGDLPVLREAKLLACHFTRPYALERALQDIDLDKDCTDRHRIDSDRNQDRSILRNIDKSAYSFRKSRHYTARIGSFVVLSGVSRQPSVD